MRRGGPGEEGREIIFLSKEKENGASDLLQDRGGPALYPKESGGLSPSSRRTVKSFLPGEKKHNKRRKARITISFPSPGGEREERTPISRGR